MTRTPTPTRLARLPRHSSEQEDPDYSTLASPRFDDILRLETLDVERSGPDIRIIACPRRNV
jgi:hypothetical protein